MRLRCDCCHLGTCSATGIALEGSWRIDPLIAVLPVPSQAPPPNPADLAAEVEEAEVEDVVQHYDL